MKRSNLTTRLLHLAVLPVLLALTGPAAAYHFPWDQGHDTTDWNDPDDPGPCPGGNCEQDPNDCNSKGSPVYVATGQFNWVETDIVLHGRPFMAISRSYQSNDPRSGVFGNGWSFDHDKFLVETVRYEPGGSHVTEFVLHVGNGKRYVWEYPGVDPLASGIDPSVSPAGVYVEIVAAAGDHIRLTGRDGGYEEYNAQGDMVSRVDRHGNRLDYSYTDGLLTRIDDGNGRHLEFGYNLAGFVGTVSDHSGRTWAYDYDIDGNLIAFTDPSGAVRRFEYIAYQPAGDGHRYSLLTKVTDATGVIVTSVAYQSGRVTSFTDGENRWSYSYSPSSKTTTKQDRLGDRQTYHYNDAGLWLQHTDALGATTTAVRNADGVITQTTDAIGAVWRVERDALGRRLSDTDPLGNITRYTYDGDNPSPSEIVSPSGRIITTTCNAAGDPLTVTDPGGATTQMAWTAQGDLVSATNALGATASIAYNAIGQPTGSVDELGRQTLYEYDARGNLIRLTDPAGNASLYEYDILDRVVRATDPEGHFLATAYDPAGRILRLTDERGHVTEYRYDGYGRLAERVDPIGRSVSYSYRIDNLIDRVTLEDGTVTQYLYDLAGRVTQQTTGNDPVSFTYNARDELLRAINRMGSVEFSRDLLGRVVLETGYQGRTVAYQYDNEDRRTRMTALGEDINYSYDLQGNLTTMTSPLGSFGFAHDAVGRRKQINLPNGCQASLQHNLAGRLTRLQHSGGFNATYDYEHDALGRITAWRGALGGDWQYDYDRNSRLVNAQQGSTNYAYTYDASGNRLENGGVYDDSNRLIEDNQHTFIYDVRGRLTRKQNKSDGAFTDFSWDDRDRLTTVEVYPSDIATTPDKRIDYRYGPFDRRWSRTEDGVIESYLYDGQDRIATMDGTGALQSRVVFGADVDDPLGAATPAGDRFYHANHQGSVTALTDGAASVVAQAAYTPYGITTVQGDGSGNPFWYTGRERELPDLYYYRARYYDPGNGRFLSEDPLGFGAGDSNFYAYVFGNPVNNVDPSGQCVPFTPDVLVDIGFIVYDVFRILKDNVFGDCDNLGENLTALGADVAGACLPAATGLGVGSRAASRAAKYGDEVFDVGRRYADDIGDLVRRNPCGCFGAGTQVQTSEGPAAIEAIQAGDRVLAQDQESGETAFKPVQEVFHHDQPRMLYALTLADEQGKSETLEVTDDHPFWVQGQGWRQSGRIVPGMVLRGSGGRWLTVVSWRPVERTRLTYNFDVADFDSYFVGEHRVWVHNGKPCNDAVKNVDKWSRAPKSIQDQMTLDAAKRGAGEKIIDNLGDPRFKGMEKWQYKVKSKSGKDSVVHYVRDPKTGNLMDFKFTKHSVP